MSSHAAIVGLQVQPFIQNTAEEDQYVSQTFWEPSTIPSVVKGSQKHLPVM